MLLFPAGERCTQKYMCMTRDAAPPVQYIGDVSARAAPEYLSHLPGALCSLSALCQGEWEGGWKDFRTLGTAPGSERAGACVKEKSSEYFHCASHYSHPCYSCTMYIHIIYYVQYTLYIAHF